MCSCAGGQEHHAVPDRGPVGVRLASVVLVKQVPGARFRRAGRVDERPGAAGDV
jgi:hypothetical protein